MKRKLYSLEEALLHPRHAQELTIFLAREKADLNRISELTNLKSLSLLDSDKLTEVPDAVYELPMLQSFRLRNTSVRQLSEKLGQLKMLTRIEISNSPLESLPSSIGQLKQLQTLYLRETQIKELPLSIGECNLRQINIWKGALETLPDTFGRLQHLKKLELQNNYLSSLPASFAQLEKLDWLTLSYNSFQQFPEEVSHLTNLRGAYFDHNLIETLPPSLGQLKELNDINLSYNYIKEFPTVLLGIEKLDRLNLAHNRISSIPTDFLASHSFHYLDIRANAFESFPLPLLAWYASGKKNSRFHYDKALSNEKDIFPMLKGKTFQRLNQKEKEAFFHIYIHDKEKIKALELPILWKALNTAAVDLSAITLAYMTEELPNKAIQKGDSIYVAGKLTMEKEKFEQQMEACGLSISKKMEEAKHILISARANKKPRKWPQRDDWSWISEAQLMAFFDEVNPSFLVEAADTDAEKVSHFIMSMDEDNMALGMSLIEGGGLPEELFTEAFIVYKLAESKELRNKAKELLKAKASPELLTVIKNQAKLNRKGYLRDSVRYQIEQRVQDYCADSGLDIGKLAYAVYIKNGSCLGLALDNASSPLRLQLLQSMMKQGELYLNYRSRIRYFPVEILELQALEKLTIYAEMGRWENRKYVPNTDFKIPEDIYKLENLEYLHISFNFDELPIESLQKLPKLKTLGLNIRNLKLKQELEKALPNCNLNIYH